MKPRTLAVVLSLLFMPTELALAAPMPPELIINDTIGECALFSAGDECMNCEPPAGWRSLGDAKSASCPDNYTVVSVRGVCEGFQNSFCCTEGHSGAPGDCINLARNDTAKVCAFVKDAANCTLPKGWRKKPDNVSLNQWVCPFSFNWTSINCTAAGFEAQKLPCTGFEGGGELSRAGGHLN